MVMPFLVYIYAIVTPSYDYASFLAIFVDFYDSLQSRESFDFIIVVECCEFVRIFAIFLQF